MAVIQSLGELQNVSLGWAPVSSYGQMRLYDHHYADYATLYRTQPNVRTCVDFLARNIAQLGLHVYRRVSDTDRERVRDHPLAKLLNEPLPPAMKLTRYRMIERIMGDLGVYFNAYLLKVPRADGGTGLLPVPPTMVTVKGALFPQSYEIALGEKTYRPAPEDVVHFRGYAPDSLHSGLSPLETLRRVLAEEAAMGDYREHYWGNSARMHGIIERPTDAPEWSQTARERFMAEFASLYSGTEQSGKTAILEEGMQWKEATFSAQESEYLAGRKLTREECARAYHIPLPMVGILDHATFCLPAHVPVFTAVGPCPIAEVKVGDKVWSHDGDRFALRCVTRSAQSGVDTILRIKTQNRTLEANPKHPVLVRRLVKVGGKPDPSADAKARAGQSRWHYEAQHVYVPAAQIRRDDTIVVLKELPEGVPQQPIGRMEFYGLLLGDGSVDATRGVVSIARADDAPYMDHYRRVMRDEFESFGDRGNGRTREGVPTQPVTLLEGERQTRFVSIVVAEELRALGLAGTAHTKRVPGWVFQATRAERLAFLRGYLDSDGSVDKRGQVTYSSCNPVLLEDVRHLCMSLGIPVSNAYHRVGQTTLPTGEIGNVDQWAINCSNPGANRAIGSHNPRHQQRLADGPAWAGKKKDYPFARGRRSEPPVGCEYSRVVSIEQLPAEPVFDLEVEGTHNFVAAGVVVHNSNIKEQHKNLYQDSLGPWLALLEQDFMLQLLPDFGDTEGMYLEFNIEEKLQGSFEEQVLSLQSAVGRPWMTANEARARQNLPSLPEGDTLVTPLNVLVGGQASPRDSAPPAVEEPKAAHVHTKARGEFDPTLPDMREQHEQKWREVLTAYFERQEKAIVSRVPKAGAPTIDQVWVDGPRWDKELAQDLYRLNVLTATTWAHWMAEQLEIEVIDERMYDWLSVHSRRTAANINATTREQVAAALGAAAFGIAVRDVFTGARTGRVPEIALTEVTTSASFGATEAAKKSPYTTKTWQTNSGNPRASHAALNGETVAINQRFSNGLLWPGDPTGGDVDERAGCQCSVGFGRG